METRIYERERLYQEVWAEPMTSLAKRYGISDVALRKQCINMGIPLPKAGHWAKIKAGHKVKIPPLPKSDGPSRVVVSIRPSDISGRKKSDLLLFLPEDQRRDIKQYCSSLTVPDKLTKAHGLIGDTKQYFRSRKESTKPPLNRVININVSDEQKERAYRFYSTLIKALEHLGYTIKKEKQNNKYYQRDRNDLFICLKEDSVPIFLKEIQKRVDHKPTKEESERKYFFIPTYDYVKTGNLHFGIDSYDAKRKNWRDNETNKIEDQIGEIIIWIMEAIHVEKTMREKRETERMHRLEEERKREQIARTKENELKQLELLNQYAVDWNKADRIRKLADAADLKISTIDKEEDKEKLRIWLKWAREKADFLDPLVKTDDEILGEGSWLIDLITDDDKE